VANLLLLLVCFFAGLLARRSRTLPEDSHRAVNAWVMFVSLPALVFRSIHGVKLDVAMLLSSASLWLVFFVPAAVTLLLVKRGGSKETLGALALCSGLGNTAFVGLPLIEAVAGKEALGPAAVVDQLGSFFALFAFAMPFAASLSLSPRGEGRGEGLRSSLARLIKSPAMIALVLAVVLREVLVPQPVGEVINRLADMLSPLALASVGWQLDLSALKGNGQRVAVGLTWKLLLAPAMVLGLMLLLRSPLGLTEKVVVAQAAMAPMVTAGVVASDHKLAPGLASALIAVGVPLSLVSVPLWWHVMGLLSN
jgi:hypothetical protein